MKDCLPGRLGRRRASQLCSSNKVLCLCRNKHIQNMHVVDLHGLHVHEAIEKTDNLVRLLRGFPCAFFSLASSFLLVASLIT